TSEVNKIPKSSRLRKFGSASEKLLERAAIHVILHEGRVFIRPPQMARMHPAAIVGAVLGDHRQCVRVAALAGRELLAPALVLVGEEIDAEFFLVGKDNVEFAVA